MSNELAVIANGITPVTSPYNFQDSAVSAANRANNFLGASVILPDVEFDELDEYEDVYMDVDYREIIEDASRLLSKEETGLSVTQYSMSKKVRTETRLVVCEREILEGKSFSYSEQTSETTISYIEGEYREVEYDDFEIIKDTPAYLLENIKVSEFTVINNCGQVIQGKDYSNDAFSYGCGSVNGRSSFVVSKPEMLSLYVVASVGAKYTKTDTIKAVLQQEFGCSCEALYEATADIKGRLVISGWLPNVQFVMDYFNLDARKIEVRGLNKVPVGTQILVSYKQGVDIVQYDSIKNILNIVELQQKMPGLDFVPVTADSCKALPINDRALLVASAIGYTNKVYTVAEDIFVLSFSTKKKEQFNFQLYKALALCYFGVGSRNAVWRALKKTAILYNIELPAAAYMCPIEYLQGIQYECILSYLNNLFKIQRPIKDKNILVAIAKSKRITELVDILLSLPTTADVYPISTIGLFASDCAYDEMLKQVAGSDDVELNKQLVQELTQLLFATKPEALAALLVSHRSDLDKVQKQRAIQVLKKYISTDDEDFEKFGKKYEKVDKRVSD